MRNRTNSSHSHKQALIVFAVCRAPAVSTPSIQKCSAFLSLAGSRDRKGLSSRRPSSVWAGKRRFIRLYVLSGCFSVICSSAWTVKSNESHYLSQSLKTCSSSYTKYSHQQQPVTLKRAFNALTCDCLLFITVITAESRAPAALFFPQSTRQSSIVGSPTDSDTENII